MWNGAADLTGANEALSKAGEDWEKRRKKMLLAELIQKVASHLDLREESIFSSSRRREISEARAIISCLAINDMPAPCSAACSWPTGPEYLAEAESEWLLTVANYFTGGYSASEVARSLSISRVNAGRCAERGKKSSLVPPAPPCPVQLMLITAQRI
jgi:hypothetical protein